MSSLCIRSCRICVGKSNLWGKVVFHAEWISINFWHDDCDKSLFYHASLWHLWFICATLVVSSQVWFMWIVLILFIWLASWTTMCSHSCDYLHDLSCLSISPIVWDEFTGTFVAIYCWDGITVKWSWAVDTFVHPYLCWWCLCVRSR